MPGFPVSIAIEPTTACNLRCPQCVSGLRSFTRPTGMMNMTLFNRIIIPLKKYLANLTLYFQGEPFLNPDFFDMISTAHKNGIYTMTSTNGHYLTGENAKRVINSGLDRIIISVDSFDQTSYSRYRIGGNIETVTQGIENLVRMRDEMRSSTPFIILQFIAFRDNENRLAEYKKAGYSLGADRVSIKTMQIYDYQSGSELMTRNGKLSRYRQSKDGGYEIRNSFFNHCWKMWHSCVVTWDGMVIPCCFDKDAGHPMGSIHGMDLKGIWADRKYRDFRKTILSSRASVDMCTNCTEGSHVLI